MTAYTPPCHPVTNGMAQADIDKLLYSELPSKVERVKREWCANCAIVSECHAQGFWVNEDNKRIALPGIFGGMTEKERKALVRA